MSTRRLRSSSLRLHFPWEVLLAICQQSDESTLRNLCLVSYGMLELAGPLLYEAVDIKTIKRLYLFFIPPSLIPSSSRLRPHLGLHRLKRLFSNFQESPSTDTIASFFPSSTWTLPLNARLSSSSPLDLLVHSVQFSANGGETLHLIKLFKQHLTPNLRYLRYFFSLSLANSNRDSSRTVDIKFTRIYDPSAITRISGITRIGLCDADVLLSRMEEGREGDEMRSVVATLDLRRIVLDSEGGEDAGHVRDTTEAMLDEEGKWLNCGDVLVEVLVASEEVKKLVDEVLREWEKEERRTRCSVVWSP